MILALFSLAALRVSAQTGFVRPRITQAVDDTRLTLLRGNVHPFARSEFDRGAVPGTLAMERMLLVLKRSPEQESALEMLLAEQQDKASPNYHHWLSPQEFGARFGPSDSDIQTITSWLERHGFQVAQASAGRTCIEFSGTAAQVAEAFHTAIHKFAVNGEEHWANASDPEIPEALAPVVVGVNAMHDFPLKPMSHVVGPVLRSGAVATGAQPSPNFTFTSSQSCSEGETLNITPGGNQCFVLGPWDFATIYNVLPLWNAGIDGTGQTIAIANDSNINIQDIRNFRSLFGLPPKDPIVVLNGANPGIKKNGDEFEAVLDTEWSGAVAKNATILLVLSSGNLGVDLSAQFVVDNNLAPVLGVSFGLCELQEGSAGNQQLNFMWQQAAAEGITVLVSSGDNGSAGCDVSASPASGGLQVNGLASTPYNVAVGGTDFNDLTNPGTFWSSVNGANEVSALSYIPETTWNDTCTNAIFAGQGFGVTTEDICNNSALRTQGFLAPVGGSGGPSSTYAKPSWQAALTPADGARDLPDVSLFGSGGTMAGSFYFLCESDLAACSTTGSITGAGGTSVSAQAFAGIMALVNQKAGERQGNANTVLYALAPQSGATCPSAANPSANCIFYDVSAGTIAMPCQKGSLNCTVTNSSDTVGILTGFSAGAGYDLATGLGTVNVANLVNATDQATTGGWGTASSAADFTLTSANPSVITSNGSGTFSITIQAKNSFNGSVTLSCTAMPGTDACTNFNPASPVMISGTTTITVTVKGSAAAAFRPGSKPGGWRLPVPPAMVLSFGSLLGLLLLLGLRHRPHRWAATLALLVLSMGIAAAGCGGGGGSGGGGGGGVVTAGSGVLVATSGGVTHSIAFTIR